MPRENRKDLREVPRRVLKATRIIPWSTRTKRLREAPACPTPTRSSGPPRESWEYEGGEPVIKNNGKKSVENAAVRPPCPGGGDACGRAAERQRVAISARRGLTEGELLRPELAAIGRVPDEACRARSPRPKRIHLVAERLDQEETRQRPARLRLVVPDVLRVAGRALEHGRVQAGR